MKAVLISIQPKWCELIASGKKTVEVRKTKPKIETPFKVYIYCTKGKFEPHEHLRNNLHYDDSTILVSEGQGKVIGEFVCDYITPFRPKALLGDSVIVKTTCVKLGELIEYAPKNPFPKDHIYGWHISDLVIYDKPRELGEFEHTKEYVDKIRNSVVHWEYGVDDVCVRPLKRPPQSWCYVEEGGAE